MEKREEHSVKFLKERKFMLIAPLLVLPFLTMFFWALGGGKSNSTASPVIRNGLNTGLPSAANPNDTGLDKMAMYTRAMKDSVERARALQSDPYYRVDDHRDSIRPYPVNEQGIRNVGPYKGGAYNDANEEKVYQRLEALNRSLSEGQGVSQSTQEPERRRKSSPAVSNGELDRLEQMMISMQSPGGPDPEMQQIDGVLDRILDVQHPQRVQERIRSNSEKNKGQVFSVSNTSPGSIISILNNSKKKDTGSEKTAFFSLPDAGPIPQPDNSITAVVHQTQLLVNGSIVKLRLTQDIYINGQLVPHDSFIYGTTQLSGERLTIKIDGIRYANSLFPVNLSVYDMDGLDGIYIPGAISRSVAKESGDQGLQSIGLGGLDPSLGAQAMNVGLEATKSFLSRKVKLVRVTVKAGYKILLKDENQKNKKQ